jgi:hypothetical protein
VPREMQPLTVLQDSKSPQSQALLDGWLVVARRPVLAVGGIHATRLGAEPIASKKRITCSSSQ